MTDLITFNVPLSSLGLKFSVNQNPDLYRQGREGPKLISGEITMNENPSEGPYTTMEVDVEAFQEITEEMAALSPQPHIVYDGEVLERATKRRIEIVVRTVDE